VVHAPTEPALVEYINSGWIENIDRDSISENVINGLPAATAMAKNGEWTFRLYVVRFDSDVYRFIFATKQASEATDRAFRDSIGTFQRISPAEGASAKPLRIKVVKVTAGSTIEKLAQRMAISDRPIEYFRVLNGLGPGDKLKQGDVVKIVVE
jgi:predicted Zn-dependent protease